MVNFEDILTEMVRSNAARERRDLGGAVPLGGRQPSGGPYAPYAGVERMLFPDPSEDDFGPLRAQPERPNLEDEDSIYKNRWDRILPRLGAALGDLPINPRSSNTEQFALAAIRGIAAGLGQRKQGELEKRLRDVRQRNTSEEQVTRERNAEARAEASANRSDLRQARRDTRTSRRELWRTAGKRPSLSEMTPAQQADREAELERERRRRGVRVPGDPTGAPKEPKEPKFTPTSWRFLSDADKLTLDELGRPMKTYDQVLSEAKTNPVLAKALQPRKLDGQGRPVKESAAIMAARETVNSARQGADAAKAQQREVYVDAAIAQLSMLPESKSGRAYVIDQVRRMAKRFKFSDDPDFVEALSAVESLGGR